MKKFGASFWVGSFLIFSLLGLALIAPYLPLENPTTQHLEKEYGTAETGHALGFGENGVDVLSNVIWASRVSLSISLTAVFLSAAIGTVLGAWAGFRRGLFDLLLMRVVDIVYSFPGILLVISLAAFLGPSVKNVVVCLVATSWVSYARMMRAASLSVSQRDFVHAAKSLGAGDLRILTKHVLPNLVSPLLVQMSYGIGSAIMVESSLGFLGLGAPPGTPSWGQMLYQGREVLTSATHLVIVPGIALVLTVLGFNLFGDGLRDFLDPKMRT